MAIGIAESLTAAAAAIKFGTTLEQTITAYKKKSEIPHLRELIAEVQANALKGNNEALLALEQLQRTLHDKKVLDLSLVEAVRNTPMLNPVERYRIKNIKKAFEALEDACFLACDDIAALVICKNKTAELGDAVIIALSRQDKFNEEMREAKSVGQQIAIMRLELKRQRDAMS